MTIPKFHEIMLPMLEFCSDGKEYTTKELEQISNNFSLSDDELNKRLNNGRTIIYDRILWARTYLKKAGLLSYPQKGLTKITDRGKDILSNRPKEMSISFLKQFDEFKEFTSQSNKTSVEIESLQSENTPVESLEASINKINVTLIEDLLDEVKNCSPRFFEKLVLDLLIAMGYGNSNTDSGELTSYSNDKGIDGIIKEDSLGLDKIYVQAKKWEAPIGRKELQEFVGALAGKRARKGVFITTSKFNNNAVNYVETELGTDTKVVLIDGFELANLMIKFNIGVFIKNTYYIKKIDSDYFTDED